MENEWRVIFGAFFQNLYNSWLPSLVVAIVIMLITPAVNLIMRTKQSTIYGFAIAITIATWTVACMLIRHVSTPQTEQPSSPEPPQPPPTPKRLDKAHLAVMTAIARSEDSSLTLRSLCEKFDVNESRMTYYLDTLQEMGLINRTDHWMGHHVYELTTPGTKMLIEKNLT